MENKQSNPNGLPDGYSECRPEGPSISNDPSINPKVWDEKCWEASMIIASSLGEQVKTMWQEYSIWVHHEAVTLTELNYGERPMDNE